MGRIASLGVQTKLFLVIGVIAGIIASTYTVVGFISARDLAYGRLNAQLQAAAHTYSYLIDQATQEKLIAQGAQADAALIQKINVQLTEYAHKQGLAYIYSLAQNKDALLYIFSSLTEEEYKDRSKYNPLFLQPYDEEEPKAKIREVFAQKQLDYLEYGSQYGEFRTLYLPATMPSGQPYVIAVDIDRSLVSAAIRDALIKNLSVGATMFILALIATFILSKAVTRPLIDTSKALESLASGQGDLTVRLPVVSADEVGRISSAFNLFVGNLAAMMQQVLENSAQLREQAAQGRHAADEIIRSSIDQTNAVRDSSAAVQQMVVSIEEIASLVANAASDTHTALASGNDAVTHIDDAALQLSGLETMVATLATTIRQLEERSTRIDMITAVIKEVADQTNLLSLNAAIEAARAGEQGRGFAVVADEVRKLADRTSASSGEIATMIGAIKQDSKDALEQLSNAVARVNAGVGSTASAHETIHTIRDFMNGFAARIESINLATREQTSSSTQIAQTMERVSSASEQNRASVKCMATIDELAVALQSLVKGFKLK